MNIESGGNATVVCERCGAPCREWGNGHANWCERCAAVRAELGARVLEILRGYGPYPGVSEGSRSAIEVLRILGAARSLGLLTDTSTSGVEKFRAARQAKLDDNGIDSAADCARADHIRAEMKDEPRKPMTPESDRASFQREALERADRDSFEKMGGHW